MSNNKPESVVTESKDSPVETVETRDAETTGTEEKPAKQKSKPTSKIGNIGDLIRAVYDGSLRRVNFKKDEIHAVESGPFLTSLQREGLIEAALNDSTLAKTWLLMQIGAKWKGEVVSGHLFEFVAEVLRAHPVFRADYLASTFSGQDLIETESVIRRLAKQDFTRFDWTDGGVRLKKIEVQRLRTNAISCLLLFLARVRGLSVRWILEQVQLVLWNRTSRKYRTDADTVCALLLAREPDLTSMVYGLLNADITRLKTELSDVRESEQRSNVSNTSLRATLFEKEEQLEIRRSEIERLESEVLQLQERYKNEKIHLQDDIEVIRGRVRACVNDEVSLLDEGLRALRREPPKVHVMIDHAERAIDGLKRAIRSLDDTENSK